MAVPKRRVSKARRDKRRSNVWKMCIRDRYKRPHRICQSCGFYKGKEIVKKDA